MARQLNALVTRRSADRTLGRFHSPEIRGAVGALEDEGYISDDDPIAAVFDYDDGSSGWEVGVVENMLVRKGKSEYPVHQLSRDDPNGEVFVRWYGVSVERQRKVQAEQSEDTAIDMRGGDESGPQQRVFSFEPIG